MVDNFGAYTFPQDEWTLCEGPEYDTEWDGFGIPWLNYCPTCGEGWDWDMSIWGCKDGCEQLKLQRYHHGQIQPFIDYLAEGEIENQISFYSLEYRYRGEENTAVAWADANMNTITVPWWTQRNKRKIFTSIPHEVAHITVNKKLDRAIRELEEETPEPIESIDELLARQKSVKDSMETYKKLVEEDRRSLPEKYVKLEKQKEYFKLPFSYWTKKERITKLLNDIEEMRITLIGIENEIKNHPHALDSEEVKAGYLQAVNDYGIYTRIKEKWEEEWQSGGDFDRRGKGHWGEWKDEDKYMFDKALKGFGHLNYYGVNFPSGVLYMDAKYLFTEEQLKRLKMKKKEDTSMAG